MLKAPTQQELDRHWIAENIIQLSDFALKQFEKRGPGLLLANYEPAKQVKKITYVSTSLATSDPTMAELVGDDTRRMLEQYNPATEVIIVISGNPTVSAYLVPIKKAN